MTDRYQIAFHEAAHAVVAASLGCRVLSVTVAEQSDKSAGHCEWEAVAVGAEFAELIGAISMAGIAANTHFLKIRGGVKADRAHVREALSKVSDATARKRWRKDAIATIESNRELVETMVELLQTCWTLEGDGLANVLKSVQRRAPQMAVQRFKRPAE